MLGDRTSAIGQPRRFRPPLPASGSWSLPQFRGPDRNHGATCNSFVSENNRDRGHGAARSASSAIGGAFDHARTGKGVPTAPIAKGESRLQPRRRIATGMAGIHRRIAAAGYVPGIGAAAPRPVPGDVNHVFAVEAQPSDTTRETDRPSSCWQRTGRSPPHPRWARQRAAPVWRRMPSECRLIAAVGPAARAAGCPPRCLPRPGRPIP